MEQDVCPPTRMTKLSVSVQFPVVKIVAAVVFSFFFASFFFLLWILWITWISLEIEIKKCRVTFRNKLQGTNPKKEVNSTHGNDIIYNSRGQD
jgi:hypothetical protein